MVSRPPHSPQRLRAFTLVEVMMALGMVTFGLVSLFGLIAMGLDSVRGAISTTVQANISQAVVNDAQVKPYSAGYTATRYFNAEGEPVGSSDPGVIYTAQVDAETLALPTGNSAGNFEVSDTVARRLNILITNRTEPGVSKRLTLVWPKG